MAIGILVYLLLALKWSHIRLYTIWMHDSLQFVVNVGVSLFIQIYGGRTILHSDICHFFFSYLLILQGFSSLIDSCCDLLTTSGGNFTSYSLFELFLYMVRKIFSPISFCMPVHIISKAECLPGQGLGR